MYDNNFKTNGQHFQAKRGRKKNRKKNISTRRIRISGDQTFELNANTFIVVEYECIEFATTHTQLSKRCTRTSISAKLKYFR